ncbi:hypothetical protein [Sagittula salina]|uniref:Replication protein n=1 Tax=Sagittula salina TaxID=2820268 RepID=A0A940S4M6_9RHOB|nr:hypothetical protein [Sagittula salina]MBP0484040.1 hypothetical protein [Sagittula salina]
MEHVSPSEFAPRDRISDISAEEYFSLLHPEGGRGRASVFIKLEKDCVETRSLDRDTLLTQIPTLLDHTSFLTLNRFWFGRRARFLAAFNALYVDLDYFTTDRWRGKSAEEVQAAYAGMLLVSGVPQPSVFLQSGRGLAAIWLIQELPAAARPRWQAAMNALIEISISFGVDKGCKDSSRVFRIPETINEKAGKPVRVSGGSGDRQRFDDLADRVFTAAGRPTRAQLDERKKFVTRKLSPPAEMPKGLTQARRFKLVVEDLEAIRIAHGGRIQEGFRNTWLHLFATCLTHMRDVGDIEGEVRAMAAIATPGLEPQEVAAIAKQAADKTQRAPSSGAPGQEGRYYYSGATLAEKLDVPPQMARELNLNQIVPGVEKRRRKTAAERQRRATMGAMSRQEYLDENSASRIKPWETLGISRSKYYQLKQAGQVPASGSVAAWTGPCPLQGRSQIQAPGSEQIMAPDTPPHGHGSTTNSERTAETARSEQERERGEVRDPSAEGNEEADDLVEAVVAERNLDKLECSFPGGAKSACCPAALSVRAAGQQAACRPLGSHEAARVAKEKGETVDLVTRGILLRALLGEHHVRYSKDSLTAAPLCRRRQRSSSECGPHAGRTPLVEPSSRFTGVSARGAPAGSKHASRSRGPSGTALVLGDTRRRFG